MKKYTFKDTQLCIDDNGKFYIFPKGANSKIIASERANFEIKLSGNRNPILSDNDFKLSGVEESDKGVKLSYKDERDGLLVTVKLDATENSSVIAQSTSVKNIGNKTVKLTTFSSSFFEGIASSEDKPWYEHDLKIHISSNRWQCEGQWSEFTPSQLGLIPASIHPSERESYTISSIGSWATGNYFPLVIIEDKDTDTAYFMETEGAHNWFIKICAYGGYAKPSLSLEASSSDEKLGGWYYDLKPNEEYFAERAFIGAVNGGFEEVAGEMSAFKRADSIVSYETGAPYVCYNDFMNGVWGSQHPELIMPLVEKAAEIGCEVFCVDGGWAENANGDGVGDWIAKKELYGKVTLADISKRISELGMIPGIWFEFDTCNHTAFGYNMDDDAIIKRYDAAVDGERSFYNFKNERVREYLKSKVAEVYNIGYRFIKNDYNHSIGIGCTNNYDGDSPAEGAIENANAFYDFINELYEEFPGLIIENCGSGALRSDNKTLRRFHLQSTSDQEFYYNNPSIVMGSMAQMPAEKAGIWAYPYPAAYNDETYRNGLLYSIDEDYVAKRKNGYETSFNMVTSMLGAMYISGRIDLCDDININLIKEAVNNYKEIRHLIPKSRPIYPTGLCKINEKTTASLGMISDEKLLLAVWNINTDKNAEITLDLSKYIDNDIKVSKVYPNLEGIGYTVNKNLLTVNLPKENSAIFVEIDL